MLSCRRKQHQMENGPARPAHATTSLVIVKIKIAIRKRWFRGRQFKRTQDVSLPTRWSMDEHSEFLRILTQTFLTSNEASNRHVKWLATHGRAHVLRPYYACKIRPSWARVCFCVFVYVCACACAWPFYWILLNSNLLCGFNIALLRVVNTAAA